MSIMQTLFQSRAQQEEIRKQALLRKKAEEKSKEFRAASEKLRCTCEVGKAAEEARKMIEEAEAALVTKGQKPRKE